MTAEELLHEREMVRSALRDLIDALDDGDGVEFDRAYDVAVKALDVTAGIRVAE